LLSIQSQIFGVSDPYFNEGNGVPEMLRYTRQGQIGSEAYNRNIQCATIRYGMIDMIRHPPIGFEDVITRHFALCRQRIVLQCKRWMHEMASTSYSSRFEKHYTDLVMLLTEKMSTDFKKYPMVLLPLEEDWKVVCRYDASFQGLYHEMTHATNQRNVITAEQNRSGGVRNQDKEDVTAKQNISGAVLRNEEKEGNPWLMQHSELSKMHPTATVACNASDLYDGYTSDDDLYK
jgi:hypothetical protein